MKDKNTITLFDEDQRPIEMEIIASLQLNNQDYAILHAIEQDQDYVVNVNSEGDQQEFQIVEDDAERQEVVDAYYELVDN